MEDEEILTSWEVGELLYGPLVTPEGATGDEIRMAIRRRQQTTASEMRRIRARTGLEPLSGRDIDAQYLWSGAAVRAAIAARPGKGNRTRGEARRNSIE